MKTKKFFEEKFDREFNDKIDPFKYFFGHVINTIDTEDQLDEYAQHNFSGHHSMSYPPAADTLVNYILLNYSEKTHIDIGGSKGHLSRRLTDGGLDSYTLDGWTYGIEKNLLEIPIEKYVVCDVTSFDFSILDLEKYFDISTAFEITEHIHEQDIRLFYDNVSYISKEHICSVHVRGLDSTSGARTNHHNVKPVEWWVEFLSQYGEVSDANNILPGNWGESDGLKVIFK